MREIVTVQVGSFANYIGSHFWNFQDELLGLAEDQHADAVYSSDSLDMDVLYRAGETHEGKPTYTPRLFSIGSQGSLGSLHAAGSLYGNPPSADSDILTWTGKVSKKVARPKKRNLFLESLNEEHEPPLESSAERDTHEKVSEKDIVECLENDVHSWTDFSKVHYHPKSLYESCCSWIDVPDFDKYGMERDAFSKGFQDDEMNDRVRFFVEECDHIQGFQFIVDDSGGFSNVAADLLESVADDYGKTPVLLYSAKDPMSYANFASKIQLVSRGLHDAISFSRLSSSCKLIVPLGLPSFMRSKLSAFLSINDAKLFHSSAVYAAGIHSISLPFRMQSPGPAAYADHVSGAVNIHELVQILTGQSRQNMATILDISMPAPSLNDQIQGYIQNSLHPLTPEIVEDAEDLQGVESVVVHGALHSGGHRASISEVQDAFFKGYQNGCCRPLFSHLSASVCPLPVPLPFPSIFGSLVGEHGELLGRATEDVAPKGPLDVNSIPMAARLRSSKAILPFLVKRLENLRRFGIQRGALGGQILKNWGFTNDEVEDMGETLSKMVVALDPPLDMSSDSD